MNFSRYIYLNVFLLVPFAHAMDADPALQAALLASLGVDAAATDADMLAVLAASSLEDGAVAAPAPAAPCAAPAAAPAPHAEPEEALRVSGFTERGAGFVVALIATQDQLYQLKKLVTTDDAAIDRGGYAPDEAARLKEYRLIFRAPYVRADRCGVDLLARLYDVVKNGELLTSDREYLKKFVSCLGVASYCRFLREFFEYLGLRELRAIMTEEQAQAEMQAHVPADVAEADIVQQNSAIARRARWGYSGR